MSPTQSEKDARLVHVDSNRLYYFWGRKKEKELERALRAEDREGRLEVNCK